MLNRLLSVIAMSLFVGLLVSTYKDDLFAVDYSTRAFGELKADFGVTVKEPLFKSLSIASGESEVRHITVVNEGIKAKKVYLKGVRIHDDTKYEQLLEITIDTEEQTIYGKGSKTNLKNLTDFFNESSKDPGIITTIIEPGKQKSFFITVSFPEKAGLDKKQAVTFDLSLSAREAD